MFQKILLPVDVAEVEVAQAGIDVAVQLARIFNSEIRLLHVTSSIVMTSPMDFVPQSYFDQLGAAEKATLEHFTSTIDLPAPRVSCVVRVGAVYPEVLAEAAAWHADLVIVGAHKPSMATYLLGSSAAAIVRHATCTVMVVRSDRTASVL